MTSLGILTVATNKYVEYWKNQARSISNANIKGLNITLHVFTDDTKAVESFSKNLNVRVIAHEIPSLGWPEATLFRYRLISQFSEVIREDILMHLDADMLLHRAISAEELVSVMKNGVCLVRHPGYYRPRGAKLLGLYLQNFRTTSMDLYLMLKKGGLGLWETRDSSAAFVPRSKRSTYVCGGTWWGYRDEILALCKELSSRIDSDLSVGEAAVWHDESHLNWWASVNDPGIADPSYCYAVGYPQLRDLTCIIEAVHK
jgi:hypothetical protein